MAVGGRIVWNDRLLHALILDPSNGVARDLEAKGEKVTQEAKRLAPVSPHGSNGRPSGWLRSQIGWTLGQDAQSVYVDIASPARSATDDAPYGLFQEVGTSKMKAQPHLRPALFILKRK